MRDEQEVNSSRPFITLTHPMRFESQTHPQDDHIDRITDYSSLLDTVRLMR